MADFSFIKPKTETIKENARPEPRTFAKFFENIRGKVDKKGLNNRMISDEELKAVKSKIRKKIIQANRRQFVFRLSVVVILLIPVYFVGQRFFKSVDEGMQIVEKQRVKAYEKRQEYIIEGHNRLKINDFYEARWFFKKAAEIDPDDYLLQLGLTRTYMNLCKYHDVDCGKAATSLQALKTEYGDQPGIQEVVEEFIEIQD